LEFKSSHSTTWRAFLTYSATPPPFLTLTAARSFLNSLNPGMSYLSIRGFCHHMNVLVLVMDSRLRLDLVLVLELDLGLG